MIANSTARATWMAASCPAASAVMSGTLVTSPAAIRTPPPAGPLYRYCFDQEWRPGMAGVSVNPPDPGAAIAWPLAIDASNPAQISAKDATAPGT